MMMMMDLEILRGPLQACNIPTGYVTNSADCDDGTDSANPDAAEICDGIDNNCNNQIDDDDSITRSKQHQHLLQRPR